MTGPVGFVNPGWGSRSRSRQRRVKCQHLFCFQQFFGVFRIRHFLYLVFFKIPRCLIHIFTSRVYIYIIMLPKITITSLFCKKTTQMAVRLGLTMPNCRLAHSARGENGPFSDLSQWANVTWPILQAQLPCRPFLSMVISCLTPPRK